MKCTQRVTFVLRNPKENYSMCVFGTGSLVKKITKDHNPLQVTEKDKESLIKVISESIRSTVITDDIKKQAFQKIKFPKYKPAYQSFTLMENGWLVVIIESVEDEYTLFDIFDQEGQYIAYFKTSIPAEGIMSGLLFFKNRKAYSVAIEDDYWFVKRYNFEIQEYKCNR